MAGNSEEFEFGNFISRIEISANRLHSNFSEIINKYNHPYHDAALVSLTPSSDSGQWRKNERVLNKLTRGCDFGKTKLKSTPGKGHHTLNKQVPVPIHHRSIDPDVSRVIEQFHNLESSCQDDQDDSDAETLSSDSLSSDPSSSDDLWVIDSEDEIEAENSDRVRSEKTSDEEIMESDAGNIAFGHEQNEKVVLNKGSNEALKSHNAVTSVIPVRKNTEKCRRIQPRRVDDTQSTTYMADIDSSVATVGIAAENNLTKVTNNITNTTRSSRSSLVTQDSTTICAGYLSEDGNAVSSLHRESRIALQRNTDVEHSLKVNDNVLKSHQSITPTSIIPVYKNAAKCSAKANRVDNTQSTSYMADVDSSVATVGIAAESILSKVSNKLTNPSLVIQDNATICSGYVSEVDSTVSLVQKQNRAVLQRAADVGHLHKGKHNALKPHQAIKSCIPVHRNTARSSIKLSRVDNTQSTSYMADVDSSVATVGIAAEIILGKVSNKESTVDKQRETETQHVQSEEYTKTDKHRPDLQIDTDTGNMIGQRHQNWLSKQFVDEDEINLDGETLDSKSVFESNSNSSFNTFVGARRNRVSQPENSTFVSVSSSDNIKNSSFVSVSSRKKLFNGNKSSSLNRRSLNVSQIMDSSLTSNDNVTNSSFASVSSPKRKKSSTDNNIGNSMFLKAPRPKRALKTSSLLDQTYTKNLEVFKIPKVPPAKKINVQHSKNKKGDEKRDRVAEHAITGSSLNNSEMKRVKPRTIGCVTSSLAMTNNGSLFTSRENCLTERLINNNSEASKDIDFTSTENEITKCQLADKEVSDESILGGLNVPTSYGHGRHISTSKKVMLDLSFSSGAANNNSDNSFSFALESPRKGTSPVTFTSTPLKSSGVQNIHSKGERLNVIFDKNNTARRVKDHRSQKVDSSNKEDVQKIGKEQDSMCQLRLKNFKHKTSKSRFKPKPLVDISITESLDNLDFYAEAPSKDNPENVDETDGIPRNKCIRNLFQSSSSDQRNQDYNHGDIYYKNTKTPPVKNSKQQKRSVFSGSNSREITCSSFPQRQRNISPCLQGHKPTSRSPMLGDCRSYAQQSTSDYFTENSSPNVPPPCFSSWSSNDPTGRNDQSPSQRNGLFNFQPNTVDSDFDILQLIKNPIKIPTHRCLCEVKRQYRPPPSILTNSQVRGLCCPCVERSHNLPVHPSCCGESHHNERISSDINSRSFQNRPGECSRVHIWVQEAKDQLRSASMQHYSCPPKLSQKNPDIQSIVNHPGGKPATSNFPQLFSFAQQSGKTQSNYCDDGQRCRVYRPEIFPATKDSEVQTSEYNYNCSKVCTDDNSNSEASADDNNTNSENESFSQHQFQIHRKSDLTARAFEVWREIQAEKSALEPSDSIVSEMELPIPSFNATPQQPRQGSSTKSPRNRRTSETYNKSSPDINGSKLEKIRQQIDSTFTINSPKNSISTSRSSSVMFPLNYIKEFSPSNPRRRDSDSSSVIHQQKAVDALNFRQHLKKFRPRRHNLNSNPYSLQAIQENIQNYSDTSVENTSPSLQNPRKKRKLSEQSLCESAEETTFYISSSSVNIPGDETDSSMQQDFPALSDHKQSPLVKCVQTPPSPPVASAMRASTPVRVTRQLQHLPFDDTMSTIFGPPSPEHATDVSCVQQSELGDVSLQTGFESGSSESEVDLL